MFNTVPTQSDCRAAFERQSLSFASLPTATPAADSPASYAQSLWAAVKDEVDHPSLPPVLWELCAAVIAFIGGACGVALIFGLIACVMLLGSALLGPMVKDQSLR